MDSLEIYSVMALISIQGEPYDQMVYFYYPGNKPFDRELGAMITGYANFNEADRNQLMRVVKEFFDPVEAAKLERWLSETGPWAMNDVPVTLEKIVKRRVELPFSPFQVNSPDALRLPFCDRVEDEYHLKGEFVDAENELGFPVNAYYETRGNFKRRG